MGAKDLNAKAQRRKVAKARTRKVPVPDERAGKQETTADYGSNISDEESLGAFAPLRLRVFGIACQLTPVIHLKTSAATPFPKGSIPPTPVCRMPYLVHRLT